MSIATPFGEVPVTHEEYFFAKNIFEILDIDCDARITGMEGSAFLTRSGLPRQTLKEIWRIACGGTSEPTLNLEQWVLACKLVALTQNKGNYDIQMLLHDAPRLPLPQFGLTHDHTEMYEALTRSESDFVHVDVTGWTLVGEGFAQHTRFTVHFSTNIKAFHLQEHEVSRRYSDFRWFARLLAAQYPGYIIPPLPPKQWTGKTGEELSNHRARELSLFLKHVAIHPHLSTSFELKTFLESSEDGLAAAKRLFSHLNKLAHTSEKEDGSMEETSEPSTPSSAGITAAKHAATTTMAAVSNLWGSVSKKIGLNGTPPPLKIDTDPEFQTTIDASTKKFDTLKKVATTVDTLLCAERQELYELARVGYYMQQVAGLRDGPHSDVAMQKAGEHMEQIVATHQELVEQQQSDVCSVLMYIGKYTESLSSATKRRNQSYVKLEDAHYNVHNARKTLDATRAKSGSSSESIQAATAKLAEAEAAEETARLEYTALLANQKRALQHVQSQNTFELIGRVQGLVQMRAASCSRAAAMWQDLLEELQDDSMVETSNANATANVVL